MARDHKAILRIKGAAISLCNLTKRYGGTVAVDNVSLEIESGEFLTILGPSGSGKTTILMMVAGFVIPSSGDILADGQSIIPQPPFKRNMGIVFQHYSLFPHLTVFQNVAFPLQMRSLPMAEIERRVKTGLELVRLSGMEARRPSQLSGGQQQRVALVRALVFEPNVLLLDEPLGPLDLKLRQELQEEIKHIHEELKVTVIFVTHDQGEALSMSDRIAIMKDGIIQQIGTSYDLYTNPANEFVAAFIGESNMLSGSVIAQREPECIVENSDGLRFSCTLKRAPANLSQVTVMIRPESIVPAREMEVLSNAFEGVVEDASYFGEVTKYRIRLAPSTVFAVHWQNRGGLRQLKRGDRVRIGWLREDMTSV